MYQRRRGGDMPSVGACRTRSGSLIHISRIRAWAGLWGCLAIVRLSVVSVVQAVGDDTSTFSRVALGSDPPSQSRSNTSHLELGGRRISLLHISALGAWPKAGNWADDCDSDTPSRLAHPQHQLLACRLMQRIMNDSAQETDLPIHKLVLFGILAGENT